MSDKIIEQTRYKIELLHFPVLHKLKWFSLLNLKGLIEMKSSKNKIGQSRIKISIGMKKTLPFPAIIFRGN